MVLKSNTSKEEYREFYDGRNVEQMPNLIADGRVPMSVAELMQIRLDVRNSDADIKSSYMDNYFDTGDAVVYHPDGDVLIYLDSQDLRAMTPESPRSRGALLLSEDRDEAFAIYEQLRKQSNVVEFKKGKLGKVDEYLSRYEARSHPVWKALAGDKFLLED